MPTGSLWAPRGFWWQMNRNYDQAAGKEAALAFFSLNGLTEGQQPLGRAFAELAASVIVLCPKPSAERSQALKLLFQARQAALEARGVLS